VTPDLIYRYQVKDRTLEDVLAADLKALNCMQQVNIVHIFICVLKDFNCWIYATYVAFVLRRLPIWPHFFVVGDFNFGI
jgi:hypothetical protein